ncbi:MAG TPA: ABC transporter permease [Thermoplasmata archaeon]|nr:ABC transporter permease [Thermoplasmata archaeon]
MRDALGALRRRPGRTALTSLGIGLAVGVVVLLLAISAGVQTSATELATSSGVDLIAASANTTITTGSAPPVLHAHGLVAQIPAADPNVAVASPWLVSDVVFGNASLWAAANGSSIPSGWSPTGAGSVGWIPSDNSGIETPTIYQGTGFTEPGDPHYANGSYAGPFTHEIVLDQGLATVLGVGVGDLLWVGASTPANGTALTGWYANATAFRVVGVSGPFWLIPSALLAFFYLSELQSVVGGASASTDYASLVLIHLTDPTTAAADQTRLETAFPALTVFTLADVLGAIQQVVNVYRTFGEIIGIIGIVVAALFATTVLQMSVDDRSREFALLRAIGYSRLRVGVSVAEEGLLLAGIGLAIGLPIAWAGAWELNRFLLGLLAGLPSSFSFVAFQLPVILTGVAVVVAIGLFASFLPAVRAMGLPVAEELRAP